MQYLLLILLHLVRNQGKLRKPDRVKALVAENCLLKHQLLTVRRSHRRAPNLRFSDRHIFGLSSLYHAAWGYYSVYDQLRKERSNLLFEDCVNGGRSVDFGIDAQNGWAQARLHEHGREAEVVDM